MWLINILPDFIFHLITLGGFIALLLSFVLGFIPFVNKYKFPIQVISTILLCFGLYFEGMIANESKWELKQKDMQLQIATLETKSAKETTKVVTKYVDRVKVVKEKGNVIIKEVPKYITAAHDANCTIPNSFVMLHNSAAKNEIPDATRNIDETASGIKLSEVAETITVNYTTYHELAEQLKGLQEWVKTQEKIHNDN